MGWSLGGPDERGRWVGYGVPAYCDHPKCNAEIDRGLAHVCGGEPFGGDRGCGLYFCGEHLTAFGNLCPRCRVWRPSPYARIKPEHPRWLYHLLNHDSWREWRGENATLVAEHRTALDAHVAATPDCTATESYPCGRCLNCIRELEREEEAA